jgi:hypothetical protein
MDNTNISVADDEWVGTKLLFENESVRVWDFALQPGQSTKIHTHKRDWLFVDVTDNNRLRIDYPHRDAIDQRERRDGDVTFIYVDEAAEDRRTHRATNNGDKPVRQILVELKKRDNPV